MAQLSFEAEVIADLTALKAVVQGMAGLSALTQGKGNNYLDSLRQGAHDTVIANQITAPGNSESDIKHRAGFTIDQIFDSLKVNYPDGPPPTGV